LKGSWGGAVVGRRRGETVVAQIAGQLVLQAVVAGRWRRKRQGWNSHGRKSSDGNPAFAVDFVSLKDEFQLFFLLLQIEDFVVNLSLNGFQFVRFLLQLRRVIHPPLPTFGRRQFVSLPANASSFGLFRRKIRVVLRLARSSMPSRTGLMLLLRRSRRHRHHRLTRRMVSGGLLTDRLTSAMVRKRRMRMQRPVASAQRYRNVPVGQLILQAHGGVTGHHTVIAGRDTSKNVR